MKKISDEVWSEKMQSAEKVHRRERTVKNATTYPHTTKYSPLENASIEAFCFSADEIL
ncbi:MAG: hypothetical protein J6L23_00800 [Clostridia bacterium]|nr:hypothetical protein [Clostridia bacterium]